MRKEFGCLSLKIVATKSSDSSCGPPPDIPPPDLKVPDVEEIKWGIHEKKLLEITTRIFVLAMISLLSSIFYQIVFVVAISDEFTGTNIEHE